MSLVAKREILAGEEILVNYGYKLSHAPTWYQDLWFRHLRRDRGWAEEKIRDWVENNARMTGVFVQIPPLSSYWSLSWINLKSALFTLNEMKMFPFNSLFDKNSPLYSLFSWSVGALSIMSVLWCEGNKTATKINVYIVNIFICLYHLSRSNNGDTLKHFTTFNVQRSRLLVAT